MKASRKKEQDGGDAEKASAEIPHSCPGDAQRARGTNRNLPPVSIQSANVVLKPSDVCPSAKANLYVARHGFSMGIRRTASHNVALHDGGVLARKVVKRDLWYNMALCT